MLFDVNIIKKIGALIFKYKFNINANRIVIFGSSGCGKTTLMNIIAGFLIPDDGTIIIDNIHFFSSKDKINISTNHRFIGYLTQENSLFPNMNIEKNILYGVRKKQYNYQQYILLIKRLKIDNLLFNMPSSLSGGQIQRVLLARVIMSSPKLLLLDEPFKALDSTMRNCLKKVVLELSIEKNIPLIFITHDIEDCYYLGEKIIILKDYKIVEINNFNNIMNFPIYIDTAKIIGFENIWKIENINQNSIKLFNDVNLNYFHFPDLIYLSDLIDNNYTHIAIRAKNINIFNSNINKMIDDNVFSGKVVQKIDTLNNCELSVLCDNNLLVNINIAYEYVYKFDIELNKKINILIPKKSIILLK